MSVVDRLLATGKPRTREVRVCLRGDLVDRHEALVAELEAAAEGSPSISGSSEVRRIAAEIVAVEEEQEDSTVTFVLQSASRLEWADLLKEHPPRPVDKGHDHNPETFPPAAVALCAVDPHLTEDEAVRLFNAPEMHTAEWNKLWMAALALNITATPHPKLVAASELAKASGNS